MYVAVADVNVQNDLQVKSELFVHFWILHIFKSEEFVYFIRNTQ